MALVDAYATKERSFVGQRGEGDARVRGMVTAERFPAPGSNIVTSDLAWRERVRVMVRRREEREEYIIKEGEVDPFWNGSGVCWTWAVSLASKDALH